MRFIGYSFQLLGKTMKTDKRKHQRFHPENFLATVTLTTEPSGEKINFEGTVVDMSYTGIKIKLNSPINIELDKAEININLIMPESGIPLSIKGVIKHFHKQSECGLQYTGKDSGSDINNLMFECIKGIAISEKISQEPELEM